MRRLNRQYLGLEGVDHGLEPPPSAWQLEVQSPIPLTVQDKVTIIRSLEVLDSILAGQVGAPAPFPGRCFT